MDQEPEAGTEQTAPCERQELDRPRHDIDAERPHDGGASAHDEREEAVGIGREERSVLDAACVGPQLTATRLEHHRRRETGRNRLSGHVGQFEQRVFARPEGGSLAAVRRESQRGEAAVEQRHVAVSRTTRFDDADAEVEATSVRHLEIGDEIEVAEHVGDRQRSSVGDEQRVVERTDEVEVAVGVLGRRGQPEEEPGQETGEGPEHPVFEEGLATAACRTRHGRRAIIGSPPR